ncbi:MAG: hypothetical protein M8353_11210, partial [ANME-2 cluster archaeon]|nr:hypothetical protein [ANME-2 cluster archaeon]
DYNVTYTWIENRPLKYTVDITAGTAETFRVSWSLDGIPNSRIINKNIVSGNRDEMVISIQDVIRSFGDNAVTVGESTSANGMKYDYTFGTWDLDFSNTSNNTHKVQVDPTVDFNGTEAWAGITWSGYIGTDGYLHHDNSWVEVAPKPGAETHLYSSAVYNGGLYGGTIPNGKLYKWNDVDAWVEVAPKLAEVNILSLSDYNGSLYGGTGTNGKLYKWNDVNAWVEVAPKLGAETHIYSSAAYNGSLYGGTSPNGKLYKWNDVDAWVEVAPALGAETGIFALIVYNGGLYGGTGPNGKLYKWNNTSAWIEVAPKLGAETQIRSLAVYNGSLYGGTYPNGKLYKWNDVDAWIEVAPKLGAETYVMALTVYNDGLYGGTSVNGKLYKWNDVDAWIEVAPTLGAETHILTSEVYNNRLYVGTYPNAKLYRWHENTISANATTDAIQNATTGQVWKYVNTSGTDISTNTTASLWINGSDDNITFTGWKQVNASFNIGDNVSIGAAYQDQYAIFRIYSNTTYQPETNIISHITIISGTGYYTDSLFYNATSPYNNIVKSDGTLIVNRIPISSDDTNWTAISTGATYWTFTTAVTPMGDTNFTISSDNLDNFTARDLIGNTIYYLFNSSGILENQTTDSNGNATFETNLVAGDYWIEYGPASFTSTTPSTPYSSYIPAAVKFSGTASQLGNFTWYFNGTVVQYNNSTSTAVYTNVSPVLGGPYNISLSFTNVNGTVQYTWDWTVLKPIQVPMSIFMMMGGAALVTLFASFIMTGVPAIFISTLGTMLSFCFNPCFNGCRSATGRCNSGLH